MFLALCTEANICSGSRNSPIEVTTDKSVYKLGEKVVIKIRNKGTQELRDSITLRIKNADGEKVFETVYMGG
jgi:O-glycosyl hydrolase